MSEINSPSLDELLEYTFRHKATDLHIAVGTPPMVRLSSRLKLIEDCPSLTPADTDALMRNCTNDARRETLEKKRRGRLFFFTAGTRQVSRECL